jgi:hypothetical protein
MGDFILMLLCLSSLKIDGVSVTFKKWDVNTRTFPPQTSHPIVLRVAFHCCRNKERAFEYGVCSEVSFNYRTRNSRLALPFTSTQVTTSGKNQPSAPWGVTVYKTEAMDRRTNRSGCSLDFAQEGMHLAPHCLDGVEVWRIGGQEADFGACLFDQGDGALVLIGTEIIHHDDVARAHRGARTPR